jgi:ATP-dependent exoDNAse (exonuclease V) alpha subunit
MTDATGLDAKTIHRLLEVDPKSGGFKRGNDNPLRCDVLVVDETSMVDLSGSPSSSKTSAAPTAASRPAGLRAQSLMATRSMWVTSGTMF